MALSKFACFIVILALLRRHRPRRDCGDLGHQTPFLGSIFNVFIVTLVHFNSIRYPVEQETNIGPTVNYNGWFRRPHWSALKRASSQEQKVQQAGGDQDVVMIDFDIQSLPEDILTGIFAYMLTLPDVPRLCRVSSQFNNIANSNTLWKLRWFYNWNLNVLSGNIPTSVDWRRICMEQSVSDRDSPSYTLPPWPKFTVTSAEVSAGMNPVYFSPIVANVKLTGGKWVYEVAIEPFRRLRAGTRKVIARDDDDDDDDESQESADMPDQPAVPLDGDNAEMDEEMLDEDEMNMRYTGRLVAQMGFVTTQFFSPQRDVYGVGDDKHSWGYDGGRRFIFHGGVVRRRGGSQVHRLRFASKHTWKVGDTVGIAIDIGEDVTKLDFFLNGEWLGPVPCQIRTKYHVNGFYPAISRSRSGEEAQYTFRFGNSASGGALKYKYPGYSPIVGSTLNAFASCGELMQQRPDVPNGFVSISPVCPVPTRFPTHTFLVTTSADAEDITFLSWDTSVIRCRVEFVQSSRHPVFSVTYGYSARVYTRVIRYMKWDSSKWSARLILDSRGGDMQNYTLCHWPATEQELREFQFLSHSGYQSDSSDDDDNAEDRLEREARDASGDEQPVLRDDLDDVMMDTGAPEYVAPPGGYIDPALSYLGARNARCTACPIDSSNNKTNSYKRQSAWCPEELRRY